MIGPEDEQCSVSIFERIKTGSCYRREFVQICTLTITLSLVHVNGCFLKIMDSQIKDSPKPIARQCCVNNLQCTSLDKR